MKDQEADDLIRKRWLLFLTRWSLGTSIVVASLITTILAFVLPASQPNPLGEKYFELIAAENSPIIYRIAITFDVLAWIGWGGLFLAFAALLHHSAPVRSKLLTLLAAGMSIGFFGACLRLAGTPYLGEKYFSASLSQQGIILQSYDLLLHVINITFSSGGLLAGIALLLIASSTKYLHELPRWVLVLMGVAGAIHAAKAAIELITTQDLGPLALLANMLLLIALVSIVKLCGLSPNKPYSR